MSEKVALVLEAVKPTATDRMELTRLGRSLLSGKTTHISLAQMVRDACGVAYVPSREFSMDLTIEQVLHKAHDDAQIDRLLTLRKLINEALKEMM